MNVKSIISVFVLSFAAFLLSILSGWIVADAVGAPGEGAALGGISSLFLALVLTKRKALFARIILSGALAGLIAYPVVLWINSSWGWFAGGAFFGLALGMAHWRLLKREVSPSWMIVLLAGWGLGLGGLGAGGIFYGLFLGAILFGLMTSLAASRPFGIVRGWATQTKRRSYLKNPIPGYIRPEHRTGARKVRRDHVGKKTLLGQRAGSRRKG